MALTNISKPSSAELWGTITTTWASETRTWLDAGQLIDNISRITSSMTNISAGAIGFLWSLRRFPWTESTPWLSEGGISNVSKP